MGQEGQETKGTTPKGSSSFHSKGRDSETNPRTLIPVTCGPRLAITTTIVWIAIWREAEKILEDIIDIVRGRLPLTSTSRIYPRPKRRALGQLPGRLILLRNHCCIFGLLIALGCFACQDGPRYQQAQ
jgi:hypothetical protein